MHRPALARPRAPHASPARADRQPAQELALSHREELGGDGLDLDVGVPDAFDVHADGSDSSHSEERHLPGVCDVEPEPLRRARGLQLRPAPGRVSESHLGRRKGEVACKRDAQEPARGDEASPVLGKTEALGPASFLIIECGPAIHGLGRGHVQSSTPDMEIIVAEPRAFRCRGGVEDGHGPLRTPAGGEGAPPCRSSVTPHAGSYPNRTWRVAHQASRRGASTRAIGARTQPATRSIT